MVRDRMAQLSPLSGILAAVSIVIGFVLMGITQYFPSPDRVTEIVGADPFVFQRGAVFLGVYAAFFVLWFSGSLAAWIRAREGGDGSLTFIAFGGGLLAAAGLAVAGAVAWIASARLARTPDTDPAELLVLYDIFQNVTAAVVSTGFAALIGATGIAALRGRLFASWLGWASVVGAIGLLTPIHYVFEVLALPWMAIVGVLQYRGIGRDADRAAESAV